jgi:hypothetical protein
MVEAREHFSQKSIIYNTAPLAVRMLLFLDT